MSLTIATKRLTKEAAEVKKTPIPGVRLMISEGNLFVWSAEIDGPKDTPYEGGVFKFKIMFPSDYPMCPPKVKCETKVFHVNINSAGMICLDLLKDKWTPLLTAQALLRSIQQLFAEPNPDDPLVPSIAAMAMEDPEEYLRRAKLFTQRFAKKNENKKK